MRSSRALRINVGAAEGLSRNQARNKVSLSICVPEIKRRERNGRGDNDDNDGRGRRARKIGSSPAGSGV